ncbi:hypothetical protein AVEN_18837-1 [Araneus ventricosus]|uniref:Uncharacterized protein n=1 Tax=Araneus ventricosus TaxID=182803 RepID=A0A4Y2IIX6_ARAVE|nr:hypothetical protein AVEN_18837-1 [Araneus ventricosus]
MSCRISLLEFLLEITFGESMNSEMSISCLRCPTFLDTHSFITKHNNQWKSTAEQIFRVAKKSRNLGCSTLRTSLLDVRATHNISFPQVAAEMDCGLKSGEKENNSVKIRKRDKKKPSLALFFPFFRQ